MDAAPMTAGAAVLTGRRSRLAEVLRDIARTDIAGLLTGVLVAGIGGRLVMRAAALLEPSALGRFTENGNRIGEITAGGSFALLLVGVFFGLAGAVLWVVVSPWLPPKPLTRVLVAAPVAVALTALSLINGFNPDFTVLHHSAATILLLLFLVAVAGVVLALFDRWLEGRLPAAGASPVSDAVYLILSVAGAGLILPVVLAAYVGNERPVGFALLGAGLATVLRWAYRYRGVDQPGWLTPFGRIAVVAAVIMGTIAVAPDIARALAFR